VTGALFKELGGQILSMTTDMTIQALKILKNSSNVGWPRDCFRKLKLHSPSTFATPPSMRLET
jgi:hypothetical protein